MSSLQTATFGSGCFWCTEAIFQRLKGVKKVTSGYSGGKITNPTYREVCSGLTGHAEVTQVEFDPAEISFEDLLEVFFTTHDPTTLNRQGNDTGTQYRSVIFYHDEEQKKLAEEFIKELNDQHAFNKPLVTEISEFTAFYPAENYHQDYFNLNGEAPYCQFVIAPKLDKFKSKYKDKLVASE
jgi:peptide-methionine (S)-S-oxide reductase